MQATNIRIDGKRPTIKQLDQICKRLRLSFQSAGFLADAAPGRSGTSLKIGGHMCQFRIDVARHGHNARLDDSPKGYRRTNVPTWEQRVQFNNLVNAVLDDMRVTCHVKSGPLTIRDVRGGAHTNWSRLAVWTRGDIVPLTGELMADSVRREAGAKARPQLRLVNA